MLMMTVKEFITFCKQSYDLYEEYIEDNGMSGDIEVAEQLENEKAKLVKILDRMSDTLQQNKQVSLSGYIVWLQQQDKEVAEIILSCLEIIKSNKEHKKKELEKEINICDSFLKNIMVFYNGGKL